MGTSKRDVEVKKAPEVGPKGPGFGSQREGPGQKRGAMDKPRYLQLYDQNERGSKMSKAEQLASDWFEKFNNHKMLFGFSAMLILTVCSIYFNMRLGRLSASPSDNTWYIMPLAYSFLDVAALVLAMAIFAGAVRGVMKFAASVWFAYLIGLSLFACLSCIIALDAQKASSGDAFKRQQLEIALAQANDNVKTWQRNVANTINHRSKFQRTLNDAIEKRDDLIYEISKLDSSTPSNQVVFEKMDPFMPAWIDQDMFKTLARLAFGIAMVLTPLLLTAVMAHVLGTSPAAKAQRSEAANDQKGSDNVKKLVQV